MCSSKSSRVDPPGGYDLSCGDGLPSPMQMGTSFTCLPEATIMQSDIDAGSMQSTARYAPTSVRTSATDTHRGSGNTTVTFSRVASISFGAMGTYIDSDSTAGISAGDTIKYVFYIENNGTTTLWSLEISSEMGADIACAPSLESLELAPGDKIACTTTYVDQDNLDASFVQNSAVVNAASPIGSTVTKALDHVSIDRESSLTIVKKGDIKRGTDRVVNAGDSVTYDFEVTNTGQTCLVLASILDANAGDVECPYVVGKAGEAPKLHAFKI
ncbi:unnamed protein product [Hapterophycus canaliculatus]